MQGVDPYCYLAPKGKRLIPIVFAKVRQQRFFLGINHRSKRGAEQHISSRWENRVIVSREKVAAVAEHKFADKKQFVVLGKCLRICFIRRHKTRVHRYYHYADKNTHACCNHFVVTANCVYQPPKQYGKCKHMQYAKLYVGVHKIRNDSDYTCDNTRLHASFEITARKRAGYAAKKRQISIRLYVGWWSARGNYLYIPAQDVRFELHFLCRWLSKPCQINRQYHT